MYSFRKSKKGFTLIELMVVVAIIGILALLGLRLYLTQQQKAKDAIVKANAGTTQTLLQSELAAMQRRLMQYTTNRKSWHRLVGEYTAKGTSFMTLKISARSSRRIEDLLR